MATSTSPSVHGTPSRAPPADKKHAQSIVRDMLAGKTTGFQLLSHDSVIGQSINSRVRSLKYSGWMLLCYSNTTMHCGYIVCKYYANHVCPVTAAVRTYNPVSGGTTNYSLYMEKHEPKDKNTGSMMWRLDQNTKAMLAKAAAAAVYQNFQPISWTYAKAGVATFAAAMFKAGQTMPTGHMLDVADAMPSTTAVKNSLLKTAEEKRKFDATVGIPEALKIGGGMSCDGLKQGNTGAKYYDLTLHYFDFGPKDALTGNQNIFLKNKILFLTEHSSTLGETSVAIRKTLETVLQQLYHMDFERLTKKFTFVTDCAAVMPNVVGASVSQSKAALDLKWLGCICHQLTTVMRTAFDKTKLLQTGDPILAEVWKNIESSKTLVRIFKQSDSNRKLPPGCALIQEVETRWCSLFSSLERIQKSAPYIDAIVSDGESLPAKKAWRGVRCTAVGAKTSLPYIDSVVSACEPLVIALRLLETTSKPTMHKVLPILFWCKKTLADNAADPRDTILACLSSRVLDLLSSVIIVHDAYIAALLLHPLLKSCASITDNELRVEYMARGDKFVRNAVMEIVLPPDIRQSSMLQMSPVVLSDIPEQGADENPPTKKFRLSNLFDDRSGKVPETDEYTLYKCAIVSGTDEAMMRKDEDMGVVQFWIRNKAKYPRLSRFALRLFAIPASSCTSERNFSAVSRIVTDDRARLSGEMLDIIMYLRSFFS